MVPLWGAAAWYVARHALLLPLLGCRLRHAGPSSALSGGDDFALDLPAREDVHLARSTDESHGGGLPRGRAEVTLVYFHIEYSMGWTHDGRLLFLALVVVVHVWRQIATLEALLVLSSAACPTR